MVTRRQVSLIILVASIVLLSFQSTAEEKYYKVVRADGSIEYTQSSPSKDAKPVDLPGLSVISPEREDRVITHKDDPEQDPESIERDQNYNGIEIASPTEQENLWGTEGIITVEVELPRDLSNGAKVQLSLDGNVLPALDSTSFTLKDVFRGEHKLVAKVVSSSGKVLATSPSRTFYIMMANVR